MIDALLQIVNGDVLDLSANFAADGDIHVAVHAEVGDNVGQGTTDFVIRQTGLPHGAQMLVKREDTGLTTGAAILVMLEESTDAGSTFHAIGITDLPAETGPVAYTASIGFSERYPEKETTETDHVIRVRFLTADGQLHAGTVDPTISVYIVAGEKVRGKFD